VWQENSEIYFAAQREFFVRELAFLGIVQASCNRSQLHQRSSSTAPSLFQRAQSSLNTLAFRCNIPQEIIHIMSRGRIVHGRAKRCIADTSYFRAQATIMFRSTSLSISHLRSAACTIRINMFFKMDKPKESYWQI